MADTPAERKAKRAWETRQRELDPEGFKKRQRDAQRRYSEKHRERIKERRRVRYQENIEAERARTRDEYARNREARKAASKKWKEANRERVREYQKHANLKRYDLSLSEKEAMLTAQGNRCACCSSLDPRSKTGWHVDHCHTTGKVRGLLCLYCNVALGKVEDSIDRLKALISYLEKHHAH
jgi:hypothetical protein